MWRGVLIEGATVYVTAKCAPRYANSDYLAFRISSIDYMQTVKEKRIERITITVDSDIIDETVVNDFKTMLQEDAAGKTQLFFQIHDVETNNFIMLRAQDRTVNVGKELIHYIDSNPKMAYHIN